MIQKSKIKTIYGYRIDALPKYIKRYSSYLLIYHFKFLPESSLKRNIRKFFLNFYNSVPLFLALNKGDIAIEVGCPNVRTMRRYGRFVGPEGKVFIIEAEKENQDILLEAKEKLGLKNVTIIPFAAWSEKKEIEFFKSDQWEGDHKIPISNVLVDNDYVNTYTSVKVQVDTLDDLLHNQNIRTFNYLSVTVNGAELEVLKGAKELIAASSKCRIYSKGHNLIDGIPLNRLIKKYLEGFDGYQIVISKGEASNSQQENWKRRAGDVFAWKN